MNATQSVASQSPIPQQQDNAASESQREEQLNPDLTMTFSPFNQQQTLGGGVAAPNAPTNEVIYTQPAGGQVTQYQQGGTRVTHYQGPVQVTEHSQVTHYTHQLPTTQQTRVYQHTTQSGAPLSSPQVVSGLQPGQTFVSTTTDTRDVSRHIVSGGHEQSRTSYQETRHTSQGNVNVGSTIGATTYTSSQQETTGFNTTASRVVSGEERVVTVNTIVGEERVIREEVREREIRVPKKIVREEIIEKTIIVPETITREEIIDDIHVIRETVIEVAKPIIHEKVVEVPEIEYRDKFVEVVQKIMQERIKEVPVYQTQERVIEVPKYVTHEKIIEVPEIEYRDVVTERIVEIPEVREQVVVREVPVPQYVEKQVPNYISRPVEVLVERQIPVPVEAITTFEYQLAQFRARVNTVEYPLYVPKFIEVAVAAECFDESRVAELQSQGMKLSMLTAPQAIGLCDVENLATEFQRQNIMGEALAMKRMPAVQPAGAPATPYKPPVAA